MTTALALAVSACGSSKSTNATSTTGPSGGTGATTGSGASAASTIKVGVLTDSTGSAASGFQTTEQGVKAGVGVAATKGIKIQYVTADTQSTPAGALAAAQQLVEQDHVFAILEVSSVFYGAAQYLFAQHVPVIGGGYDGPEWATGTLSNLFDVGGSENFSSVATTTGTFMKSQGGTTVGVLGYGISATSAGAASGAAMSAQHAGLKVGYQNLSFAFGSTDVQPVAIAMKNAGVDAIYAPVVPSTGFALYAALLALGVHPKAYLLPTGYGGDLLQSPTGVQAAQGIDFTSSAATIDVNIPGTAQFKSALSTYAGVTGVPTFSEYQAYLAVAGLAAGLAVAGRTPTAASFTSALRNVSNFDGFGMYGSHTINFSVYGTLAGGIGPGNCFYVAKLSGSTFTTVAGASPVCGTIIPGLKAQTGA